MAQSSGERGLGMSIPESEYKNQKCACFIEIERLESENVRLKSELENVHKACDAIEKERTDYLHDCDRWKALADQLAGVLRRSHPDCGIEYCFIEDTLTAYETMKGERDEKRANELSA